MLYELRIYEIVPGRMQALHDRFANVTLKMFEKHGIKALGFWETEIGTGGQLTYLVQWESLAQRDRAWNAFVKDPEWLAAKAKTEETGPIVARVVNTLLAPTYYSPMR